MALRFNEIDTMEFLYQFVGGGDLSKWNEIKDWVNSGGSAVEARGGRELAYVDGGNANFSTTSTAGTQVVPLTLSFKVPTAPYVVKFGALYNVQSVGEGGSVMVRNGTLVSDLKIAQGITPRAHIASPLGSLSFEQRFPNYMHSPVPGTAVTYTTWITTTVGTSTFELLGSFFGNQPPAFLAVETR